MPRLFASPDKGRIPPSLSSAAPLLLATILCALAALPATAVDPKCASTGTSISLTNMPAETKAVITYGTNWNLLSTVATKPSSEAVVIDQANVVHVEFYSDAKCTVFLDSVNCPLDASATSAPTTKATSAPTTKATTAPTTKATTAPTTKATSAPTTKATTAPTTAAPTTKATTAPTTKATTAPTTKATTAPTTTATISGSRAPRDVRGMFVWDGLPGDIASCLFNTVASSYGSYSDNCFYSSYAFRLPPLLPNSFQPFFFFFPFRYEEFQTAFINNITNPHGDSSILPYNRIYLEIGDTLTSNPTVVRSFLTTAHAAGIAVEYLAGDASWIETAAATATPKTYCDNVVAFNQGSTNPAEWLDGIQYDIEPNGLSGWHTATKGAPDNYNQVYEANLMAVFNYCMDVTRPTTLTVSWDAGNDFYYYVTGLWGPLTSSTPFVDYVIVMKYDFFSFLCVASFNIFVAATSTPPSGSNTADLRTAWPTWAASATSSPPSRMASSRPSLLPMFSLCPTASMPTRPSSTAAISASRRRFRPAPPRLAPTSSSPASPHTITCRTTTAWVPTAR